MEQDKKYEEIITAEIKRYVDEKQISTDYWGYYEATKLLDILVDKKIYNSKIDSSHPEAAKIFVLLSDLCRLICTLDLEDRQAQVNLRAYVKSLVKNKWLAEEIDAPDLALELDSFKKNADMLKFNQFSCLPVMRKKNYLVDQHCNRLCKKYLVFVTKDRVLDCSEDEREGYREYVELCKSFRQGRT